MSGENHLQRRLRLGCLGVWAAATAPLQAETVTVLANDAVQAWPVALLVLGGSITIGLLLLLFRQRHLTTKLRRQAEDLRTSEERLTLVVEGSDDAFWDWDLRTGRMERSDHWMRILGYSRTQISPTVDAFKALTHPDDVSRLEAAKEQILRDGRCRVEYRLRAIDGSWRWIYDRGKVVARDDKGKPTRVTGAATDVTLRKRIEQALVRSQSLLEQTQAAAGMGGWEYEARQGTFFWTKQVYRIHELDTEQENVSLEQVLQFCVPADRTRLKAALDLAVEKAEAFDLEIELLTAKQHPAWVRYIGRSEQNSSGTPRVYGSVQDITQAHQQDAERRKLESKMLEAQKLESLGVLAGGIAHDFNNILTVIMGSASLAREEPSLVSESLDHIQTAANRAADLCRQMLAYAGKSRFALEIQDMNVIVRETVDLVRLSIRKNAELEFSLAKQVLPVEADGSQIRQVIMNLVINASDSITEQGGRIRLSTYSAELNRERLRDARIGQDVAEGHFVMLEVSDTGSGMSQETLNRIFDPFFTTKFTGRGLGLAAVLGIVRAHHGAFFVRSQLGQGSVFTLALPTSDRPPPLPPPSEPVRTTILTRREGKILVVDDEPEVRKVAGAILEKQGYTVALASDGYEALALALAHGMQFKCVLLDLTMPGLDGPSTFRELRLLNRHVPILIMSGFSESDARKQLSVDARVAFLAKPFSADELARRVDALPVGPIGSSSPFPERR